MAWKLTRSRRLLACVAFLFPLFIASPAFSQSAIGGAIAGVDTGTIFIENGRFHGQKIVESIAEHLRRLSE